MKKFIVVILFILVSIPVYTQTLATDSGEQSVFTFYTPETNRFEISRNEALSFTFRLFHDKMLHFTDQDVNGQIDTTVLKSRGLFTSISIENIVGVVAWDKIKKLRPGLGVAFNWQTSIDEIYDIDKTSSGTFAYGFGGRARVGNIQLYNTENNIIEDKNPLTLSLEGNLTYFPNFISHLLFSFTASQSWTSNEDDLLNYQTISNTTITPNIVALESFDGKYGKLEELISHTRVSIAAPLFFGNINPLPYVSIAASPINAPIYRTGIFLNIFSKAIDLKKYNLESTLGFGVDWKYSNQKWSSPNLTVSGSISL